MSVKDELHELVDRLDEERAADALAAVRRFLDEDGRHDVATTEAPARRTGPPVMSGREFMSQPRRTWQELAAEQGVRPVERFEDLLGDFWPEDETADDFIAAVREWRREGGRA